MYKIREAVQSDCAGIGKVYCDSWKTAYRDLIPQAYLDSLTPENCMPRKVTENNIVLTKDERVSGICHVSEARNRDRAVWGEIITIYLLPEIWGSGAGSELFSAAIRKLEQNGFQNICLWVLKDNKRARKFYEKNGFEISGEEREIEVGGGKVYEVEYIYSCG